MISSRLLFKIVKFYGVLGVSFFLIHLAFLRVFPETFYAPDILFSHLLLFLITVFAVIVVEIITKVFHQGVTSLGFLGASLFKIIISIIYLFPILRGDFPYQISYIIQFFFIYFFYLFAEVLYFLKKMKK